MVGFTLRVSSPPPPLSVHLPLNKEQMMSSRCLATIKDQIRTNACFISPVFVFSRFLEICFNGNNIFFWIYEKAQGGHINMKYNFKGAFETHFNIHVQSNLL